MYRYYAQVTFPEYAVALPKVNEWLVNKSYDVYHSDGIVSVEEQEVNYGEIEITEILDEECVPYDHWHIDSNECEKWTVYVRFNSQGKRIAITETDFENGLSNWASGMLNLFDAGNMEEFRAKLANAAKGKAQFIQSLNELVDEHLETSHL